MPTEDLGIRRHWHTLLAGATTLAAAPFLLFPTLLVEGTFLALVAVAGIWLLLLLPTLRPTIPVTPFNGAFLIFAMMILVGILVTADPDLTLPKTTGLILGLTAWYIIAKSVREWGWTKLYITGFALLGLGFVALGTMTADWVAKFPSIAAILDRLPTLLVALPESGSGGVHPNQLAATILVYLPVPISHLIALRFELKSGLIFVVDMMLAILLAALLVLTQSRSGWAGGIGGVLVLLVLWGNILPRSARRRRVWIVAAMIILIALLAILFIGPSRLRELWLDPQQETAIGNVGTLGFRQEVWRWSIVAIGDFPFTGTGLGSFRQVVRRFYPLAVTPAYDIAHAHNIFLQVALDVGLAGLIVYLAILMIAGVVGWQVAKEDKRLRPISLGLLAGLAALHLFGMTDALSLGSKPGLIFWTALGLLTGMHSMVKGETVGPDQDG